MAEFLVVQNVDLAPPVIKVETDPVITSLGLVWEGSFLLLTAATPERLLKWWDECREAIRAAKIKALVGRGEQEIAEDPARAEALLADTMAVSVGGEVG